MHIRSLIAGMLLALLPHSALAAEEMHVVASIKPVHALASAVMDGVATPQLLVDGAASPHTFHLRPSQMQALAHAQVVFYVDDKYEHFLAKPLAALPEDVVRVELTNVEAVKHYPLRAGGVWEAEHAPESAMDPHIWLDVDNARVIAKEMAQVLSARYPQHAKQFKVNAVKLDARLAKLDASLRRELAGLSDKPFIVFHDGYQYMEKAYGLTGIGSVVMHPDQPPGARRMSELRAYITDNKVACMFHEPQFDSRLTDVLTQGNSLKTGVLDTQGATLESGPQLYEALMRSLAESFRRCLG